MRKYAALVTEFVQHDIGRDYVGCPKDVSLLLPNGYIQQDGKYARLTVYSRAINYRKFDLALQYIDLVQPYIKSFEEALHLLIYRLGLTYKKPELGDALYLLTSTTYPDATDPGTTTSSGRMGRTGVNEAFSTLRNSAGNFHDNVVGNSNVFMNASTTSSQYANNYRLASLFDASAIDDTATIDDGTVSLYGRTTARTDFGAVNIEIVVCAPASNVTFANSDYNIANWTMTKQATGIATGSWNGAGYNNFTLNSTGKGNVSKTGITKFGFVNTFDCDNTSPSWYSSGNCQFPEYDSGAAGTTTDPKMVINYSLVSPAKPRVVNFRRLRA